MEHFNHLPPWLERMRGAGTEDRPARVIFMQANGTEADMSVHDYIVWRIAHPDEAQSHPSYIADDD